MHTILYNTNAYKYLIVIYNYKRILVASLDIHA